MRNKNKSISKNKKTQFKYLFIIILLVGILLRTYDLSSENISFDEANELIFKGTPNSDITNPPFYYLFLNYWVRFFGDNEFSIRFPSVIFGVLSVLALYYLANLLFNKRIALLSTLILAINPFHIFFSQQARMYSLFTLFSLLSLFYFFKVLKEKKKINWWFYIIFNLLNLYTHYFAIFVLLVEFLYFVLYYKNFKVKFKYFMLTNFVILALFSPSFFKIYNGLLSKTSDFNWGLKPSEYFISIFNSFLGWNILFTMIIFLLFLFGLLKLDKKTNNFGLLYVLLPIIIGFFLSFKMPIVPKYFIFIVPVYIVFISKGLINIKYKRIQLFLVIFILLISGFELADYYFNPYNPQWKESVEYIGNKIQKEDVILLGDFTKQPFEYYYKGDLTKIKLWPSVDILEKRTFYNNLKPKLNVSRVWLILFSDFKNDRYYKYRLEQDFKLIESKQFIGVSVNLYEKI